MSQGWILPDGSMSSNEMEYNTPWLFEDPISDDLPQAAGTISAFVDPRVAAASKTGALTDYINAGTRGGSSSSGANTPWLPGESVGWSGGLGLSPWAANGLAQAGKFGLGMMGAPSFVTGPLGAYASSLLGDKNSTAESVRNKVGNSIIGAGLSAINPIAGIANTALGAFGFDAMRGLTNLNAVDPPGGGTKAGFWNDAQYGTVFTGYEGSLSAADNLSQAPSTEYVSGLMTLPSGVNASNYQSNGSSSNSGTQSNSNSGWGGYSYSGPGSSVGTGGSDSSSDSDSDSDSGSW